MAGLVLLLAVSGGAVVQWWTPGTGSPPPAASGATKPSDTPVTGGGAGRLDAAVRDGTADGGRGVGAAPLGSEPGVPGTEPSGTDASSTDAVGTDAAGTGASGAVAPGSDAPRTVAPGTDTPDAVGRDSDATVVDAATGLPVGAGQTGADGLSAPWWRRALPVEGRVVPVEGDARGQVRLDVVGEQAVQVSLTGIHVSDPRRTGSVRIGLSAGDVIGEQRAQWVGDDVPVDIGSFTPDGEHPVLVVIDPEVLPPVVHSVLLLDSESGRVLGGAEMLPTR